MNLKEVLKLFSFLFSNRCSETPLSEEGTSSRDVVCGAASRNHYTYIPVLLALVTVGGLVITG